jgi:dTDP-4-amino-4,6-dideoxygalactose transaminase
MIPVMKPQLPTTKQVLPYLERMDESGVYSNFGPLVSELELRYADFFGVKPEQVVTVANATLGIQGSCTLFPPHEWVLPSYTFSATLHAVLQSNLTPILADVDQDNLEMILTESHLLDCVGLLPVMPFGKRPDPTSFPSESFVVIDAAASIGASESALSTLSASQAVVFSLHATKVLGAGEGGLVVFGDPDYALRFRKWTNFAFDLSRLALFPATNAKMSEIHAAYALAALDGWSVEKEEWSQALQLSNSAAARLGIDSAINSLSGVRPYWIARFGSMVERDSVEAALAALQIHTRHWWPEPLNAMPAFADVCQGDVFPGALSASQTLLGLPMFRGISKADIQRIEQGIQNGLLH